MIAIQNMIQEIIFYALFLSMILIICFFAYIKIYHPFWYLQPVFHFYNLKNYLLDPHIIDQLPKRIQKYTNTKDIETIRFCNVSDDIKLESINLIRLHFLRNNKNVFQPDLIQNFLPYFNSSKESSFLTLYYRDQIKMDYKTSDCKVNKHRIIGMITSAPIEIHFIHSNTKFKINYVDYLCVDKKFRKQGVTEKLIHNHDYNQRINNPSIQVSLFKREGTMNFIVPLCIYKSYIRYFTKDFRASFNNYKYKIQPVQIQTLVEFLKTQEHRFDCIINYSYSTLYELIKTKNLIFVSIINDESEILALYILKDTCTFLDHSQKMLSCIASICLPSFENEFQTYFDLVIQNYFDANKEFSAVIIEEISDNYLLVSKDTFSFVNMAFFLYNYTHNTILPHNFLFLG